MFPLFFVVTLALGKLIIDSGSSSSSKTSNATNGTNTRPAPQNAAVPRSGNHDYMAAYQGLESQLNNKREAALADFERDFEEYQQARQAGRPIPERLLRGPFRQQLRIMAEKQRREQQTRTTSPTHQGT